MKGGKNPSGSSSTESVRVAVRCRPMNKKEMNQSNLLSNSFFLTFYPKIYPITCLFVGCSKIVDID